MTINDIISNFLNDMVEAQYNSYKKSTSLASSSDIILPIPFAEIKEITLDLNYAYETVPGEGTSFIYDHVFLLEQTLDMLKERMTRVFKLIIREIDGNVIDIEEWAKIKEGILSTEFQSYMLECYRSGFLKTLMPIIENSNSHKTSIRPNDWIEKLQELEHAILEKELYGHKEIGKWVSYKVQLQNTNALSEMKHLDEEYWEHQISASKKAVTSSLPVVVDYEKLRELDEESIQKAKIVMRMRNIELQV